MANGQRQIDALDRQMKALEKRKAGLSFFAIANDLGYATPGGAYKAVMTALKKTLQEPADELRKLETDRLDELLEKLWPHRSKPMYVDRILRVMERRAKLLGLDAPQRQEVTGADGGAIIITELSPGLIDKLRDNG